VFIHVQVGEILEGVRIIEAIPVQVAHWTTTTPKAPSGTPLRKSGLVRLVLMAALYKVIAGRSRVIYRVTTKGSTQLELLILNLLARRPMYGYELVQEICRSTNGTLEFGEGSVYPVLHDLEADGMLASKREILLGRERMPICAAVP